MSAVVWGGPDKTGEVHDDQNDDDDQNDATAPDLVRIYLNNLLRFKSLKIICLPLKKDHSRVFA